MNERHEKKPAPHRVCRRLLALVALILLLSLGVNVYFLISLARVSLGSLKSAEKVAGLDFSLPENRLLLDDARENLERYRTLRRFPLDNAVAPALQFNPLPDNAPTAPSAFVPAAATDKKTVLFPSDPQQLAFLTVAELGELIRSRQVSSLQLTRLYLERLKKYGPKLECVVTLTEELALSQARRADEEIGAGRYRGPLHGIPWGAKDLLSTKGIRTTWGSAPYQNQVPSEDATVVRKLEEAGAVLVAKLTLGELAWGDVWFGGMTRNPWNLEQGSSGSSAGPASATAAGLVAFAIGSETWGSIVSPSTRCGVTGLRPTFGRVSRSGAMTLSWSMDKLGPICRSVEDCALVLQVICGSDGKDLTVLNRPFQPSPGSIDLRTLRIGYLQKDFNHHYDNRKNDRDTLATLRRLGVVLIPLELPQFPLDAMSLILNVEAAAAFQELTLSHRDDLMKRQVRDAWPNVFRHSQLVPAVEYLQANRIRTLLMRRMAEEMKKVDLFLAPALEGDTLLLTNLTGHPALVLPNGRHGKKEWGSITFIGNLFDEERMLAAARAYQEQTSFHRQHPSLK